ncbi:MAG TPA: SIMPL domain-containing protein [Chitinophagaceae bacterium]|nr:SIMPL domain-containing protein [Chitinophagaceae bacterium]
MENVYPSKGATLRSVSILVTAVLIAGAVSAAGYFIGTGIQEASKPENLIRVKGQAEKTVESNEARFVIQYETAAATGTAFSEAATATQAAIQQFLLAQGFKETEIKQGAVQMKTSNAASNAEKTAARFTGTGSVTVATTNVTLAASTREAIMQLIQNGVSVSGTQLQYFYTDINAIKGDLLKEATANAKTAAVSFAENAGVKIKSLQSASEGAVEIAEQPTDGAATGNSSLSKKVTVVVNAEFTATR